MICVIQRVKEAQVTVGDHVVARIGPGILTLIGVAKGDRDEAARKMVRKICDLRIFEDDDGKMNRSLLDIGGEHLLVSQFTLAGDCSSGRRPSFINAERPEEARRIYELALEESQRTGARTAAGIFQADMKVTLVNDGPVTFVLQS